MNPQERASTIIVVLIAEVPDLFLLFLFAHFLHDCNFCSILSSRSKCYAGGFLFTLNTSWELNSRAALSKAEQTVYLAKLSNLRFLAEKTWGILNKRAWHSVVGIENISFFAPISWVLACHWYVLCRFKQVLLFRRHRKVFNNGARAIYYSRKPLLYFYWDTVRNTLHSGKHMIQENGKSIHKIHIFLCNVSS